MEKSEPARAPPGTLGGVETVRVDPAALERAAAELARLAGVVRAGRDGADARVRGLAGRAGEIGPGIGEQWRSAAAALDVVEGDFRELARALSVLATYFADLDRHAVGRRAG